VVRAVQARGADVFLDLKFHDIPNTVKAAVRIAAGLGVRLVTVHASGGAAMMAAAVAGAGEASSSCEVLGVTVLTSLDAASLGAAWGRSLGDVEAEVLRLAAMAKAKGLHGVVCSGRESAAVTARYPGLATLVPGVRLAGGASQDQARVVTPGEAAAAGARYIVLGRAVTAAESPSAAMRLVLADLP
jgi:orotidine-5'-phosphate decarboxylase